MSRGFSLLFFMSAEFSAAYQNSDNFRKSRVRHEAHNNATSNDPQRRSCDSPQLDYRLRILESQLSEKSENLRSEIRQNNYRLRNLERQSASIQSVLETFRHELAENNHSRYSGSGVSEEIHFEIDNLKKGLQIVIAALRGINTNVESLKRNAPTVATAKQTTKVPLDCQDLFERGTNFSGIYLIQPPTSSKSFMVLCDLDSHGGGWTVIHNRYSGLQDFYLNWSNYKIGFGNLVGEFWLGLEYVHQLTGDEVNELLVEVEDVEGRRMYAHYGAFSLGNEDEGYSLKVLGGYSGTAGDSLVYHAGNRFSARDKDQDEWEEGSCAQAHSGAWWYKSCDMSNLNGKYLKGQLPEDLTYKGMYWSGFHGPQYSLVKARMMIRPQSFMNYAAPEEVPAN